MLSRSRVVLALFVTGILAIVTGMMLMVIAASSSGSSSSGVGAVIFLGPIPVVIGAGPGTVWILLVAVLISILIIMAFLLRRERSGMTRRYAGSTLSSPLRRRTCRGISEPALPRLRP